MRHRHGAAVFDLLAETRDDRTVRPQHVAEAGGDELRAPFDPPAYDRLSETLYIDFGQPFVQPMTLVGFTALSVEIITIFSTP